ncbi:MAG: glycosyltransferase [Bacteroidales bacterium]
MSSGNNIFMLVVFIMFATALAVQLGYYLWFYLAPVIYRPDRKESFSGGVSVIICARNEAENLRKHLPAILEQDYPDFEVIVVNDCSEDSSDEVLGELLPRYPKLHVSNITKDPRFTHNKKFAQFIGIKAARNEILVFTDADCKPVSDKWLKGIVSHFGDETAFVLGYGGYTAGKGLLNSLIRYDSMFIAMQYLGMAIRGVPYMGVGRNLAYRKSVFFANKGFGPFYNILSGDDDLFVNSIAKGPDTKVEFTHETHTRSVPANSVGEWVKQKRRHFTTARYYKARDKALLVSEPASRLIFYAAAIILFASGYLWQVTLGLFLLRVILYHYIVVMIQKRLNENKLIHLSLIFDIFSPLINSALYLGNFGNRPGNAGWK